MKSQNSSSKIEKTPENHQREIFDTSLDLFSQKGFDAVSVREIAGKWV